MEELLSLDFFNLKPEYIKIITFIWTIIKCTVLLVVIMKLSKCLTNKIFTHAIEHIQSEERKQQFLTLKVITSNLINTIVFAVFAMNMLNILGIDVRPILATAGVLGVAIGFGAQKTVEDFFSGIRIILEGQIRVGDYVEIGTMSGFVEKITLPLITIRDTSTGAVQFIRCGSANNIVNHTMDYSYASFTLTVAYKENIDHVFRTIKNSYEILLKNEDYKKLVMAPIDIFGLDEFMDSSISIKCRIKTQPKGQWTIKRAFNKIIKEQFDMENIEIPFNQLVVTNAKD